MNDKNPDKPENSQLIIYQSDDGKIKIDVRFQGETVWLTQQLMAELFQTTKQNISLHVQSIFEEGELVPEATVKEYLTVRQEGSREVKRCRHSESGWIFETDSVNLAQSMITP